MKLYTVIFALFGRSTITQGRAESPQRAFGVWSDDIMMRKGRATPFRMSCSWRKPPRARETRECVAQPVAEGQQPGMVLLVETDESVA